MVTCTVCKLNYDERRGACPKCGAPLPEGVVVQQNRPRVRQNNIPNNTNQMPYKTNNMVDNTANLRPRTSNVRQNTGNISQNTGNMRQQPPHMGYNTGNMKQTASNPTQPTINPRQTASNTRQTASNTRQRTNNTQQKQVNRNNTQVNRNNNGGRARSKIADAERNTDEQATGIVSKILGFFIIICIVVGIVFFGMSTVDNVRNKLLKPSKQQEYPTAEEEEDTPVVEELLSDTSTELVGSALVEQGSVEQSEDSVEPTEPSEPTEESVLPDATTDVTSADGEKNPVGSLKNPSPIGKAFPYGGVDITLTNAIAKEFEGTVVLPTKTTVNKFGVVYVKIANNLDDPLTSKNVDVRFIDKDTGVWFSDDYILKYKGEDSELVKYKTHGSWEIKGGEECEVAVPFDLNILKATDVAAVTVNDLTMYYSIKVDVQ